MHKTSTGLTFMLLALTLAACLGSTSSPALDGTRWVLGSLDGDPPLDAVTITLAFEDGQLSGDGGCNQYGGSYSLSPGGKITITELISTLRACLDNDLTAQESRYLQLLAAATSYRVTSTTLELSSPEGSLTFTSAD